MQYLELAALDSLYLFVNKLTKNVIFFIRTFDQNAKKFDSVGKISILRRVFSSFLRQVSENVLLCYVFKIQRVLCIRCFLRLWKNNRVSGGVI